MCAFTIHTITDYTHDCNLQSRFYFTLLVLTTEIRSNTAAALSGA